MFGGPDDGEGLYPEGDVPCLVCGREVATDWDGYVIGHFTDSILNDLGDNDWCRGSRTSWQVPS